VSKLVRDKLPGVDPTMNVYAAPERERAEWLLAKLQEEVEELWTPEDREHLIEELGDVWEAFKGFLQASNVAMTEVVEAAREKKMLKGGFDKLLIWDESGA